MKSRTKRTAVMVFAALVLTTLASNTAWSGKVALNDGTVVYGEVIAVTKETVRIRPEGQSQVMSYPMDRVNSVSLGEVKPKEGKKATAPEEEKTQATLPAGTRVLVRMSEPLDSSQHKLGHIFAATLQGDLIANGKVIAKRGSSVYGRLIDSRKSGQLAGKSELMIQLSDIMVDNRPHQIATQKYKVISEKTGKQTVDSTGHDTAVGGLTEEKNSAKTGAKVGLGSPVLTRGKKINIPAGTLLEFNLSTPFVYTP